MYILELLKAEIKSSSMQFKWVKYIAYSRSYCILYIKDKDEILQVKKQPILKTYPKIKKYRYSEKSVQHGITLSRIFQTL